MVRAMELKGKVAIVTGAAQGIGEGVARRFAAEGAQVVAMDVLADRLAQLGQGSNGSIYGIPADLSSADGVAKAFESVEGRFGSVNILVNCAAAKPMGSIENLDDRTIDRALSVGIKGLFLCARHAAKLMRANSGGAIITMSSFYAKTPSKDRAIYIAVKGAVESLTRALAVEFADDNIRVNCLAPGPVLTPLRAARGDGNVDALAERYRRAPMKRFATMDEVIESILFLATPRSSYMTGHVMALDGGLTIV
jgi:NAD(P)-dependent dehydrogenase (short-subunit alcohol dehydrogenase family)